MSFSPRADGHGEVPGSMPPSPWLHPVNLTSASIDEPETVLGTHPRRKPPPPSPPHRSNELFVDEEDDDTGMGAWRGKLSPSAGLLLVSVHWALGLSQWHKLEAQPVLCSTVEIGPFGSLRRPRSCTRLGPWGFFLRVGLGGLALALHAFAQPFPQKKNAFAQGRQDWRQPSPLVDDYI